MIKPKSNCGFYRCRIRKWTSKEKTGTIEVPETKEQLIEWCEHPNSPHQKGVVGQLKCHGDIRVCPIIPHSDRK